MSLLSPGSARQVAIDLLRSGHAFKDNGVSLFKRAYRATQRADAPDEAVSEFRNLINLLRVQSSNSLAPYRRRMGAVAKTPEAKKNARKSIVESWFGGADPYFMHMYGPEISEKRARQVMEHALRAAYPEQRRQFLRDANAASIDAGIQRSIMRLFGDESLNFP